MKGAQLWKRILNEGVNESRYRGEFGMLVPPGELAHHIVIAPIIVCRLDAERAGFSIDDYMGEVVAPPFGIFWIEFPPLSDGALTGCLFWNSAAHDDGSFMPSLSSVVGMPGQRPMAMPTTYLQVSREHRLMDRPRSNFEVFSLKVEGSVQDNIAGATLAALSLLSCKNVQLQPNECDEHSARRATRLYGDAPEMYRYHTLVVRTPNAMHVGVGPSTEAGLLPYHICRGHTAEYGPEFGKGLLFGKHAGRFYIPPHHRGDKKNGVVEKDYRVGAP